MLSLLYYTNYWSYTTISSLFDISAAMVSDRMKGELDEGSQNWGYDRNAQEPWTMDVNDTVALSHH